MALVSHQKNCTNPLNIFVGHLAQKSPPRPSGETEQINHRTTHGESRVHSAQMWLLTGNLKTTVQQTPRQVLINFYRCRKQVLRLQELPRVGGQTFYVALIDFVAKDAKVYVML